MNTKDLQFTKKDDVESVFYHEWGIEPGGLRGTWKNVNPITGQISRFTITLKNDTAVLNCFGKVENGELDWGQTPCELFSSKVSSKEIEGFVSNYDFGFMETRVVGNVKYGVTTIQSYNSFKDGSNRNNYITREFFVLEK
jgi:hypothetical protein